LLAFRDAFSERVDDPAASAPPFADEVRAQG